MKRILLGLTVGFSFAFAIVSATARDLDSRDAHSPLHDWFNHLASGKGLCCSMADGETIVDPDWESKEEAAQDRQSLPSTATRCGPLHDLPHGRLLQGVYGHVQR
jgi:hypothetical protein